MPKQTPVEAKLNVGVKKVSNKNKVKERMMNLLLSTKVEEDIVIRKNYE